MNYDEAGVCGNWRTTGAIERLDLPLHPRLTVLHGDNGHGKTSVLTAIAAGLGGYGNFAVDDMLGPNYNTIRHPFTDADPAVSRAKLKYG